MDFAVKGGIVMGDGVRGEKGQNNCGTKWNGYKNNKICNEILSYPHMGKVACA